MTNDSMENMIKNEKARIRGSQLQLNSKPQEIKVSAKYKQKGNKETALLSDSEEPSRGKKQIL
jgi:hypothetical protein